MLNAKAIALALAVAGVILSRVHEPGIAVESRSIGQTPALHFAPSASGSHPRVLLAHGFSASKETLFRYGEALAVTGFDAWIIDLPGHGDSPLRYPGDNARIIGLARSALGPIDVFVGHSMGGYAGGVAVKRKLISPRLFISVGALPDFGADSPEHLVLAGRFEEAIDLRKASSEPVVSPWSDHALEPYDPILIRAAVDKSAAMFGFDRPKILWRWVVRLLGLGLSCAGALRFAMSFERARPFAVAPAALIAIAFSGSCWLSVAPSFGHVPLQLTAIALLTLMMWVLSQLKAPRWLPIVAVAFFSLTLVLFGHSFQAMMAGLAAVVFAMASAIGWIARPRVNDWKAALAFGIFAGYALGQWMPAPL